VSGVGGGSGKTKRRHFCRGDDRRLIDDLRESRAIDKSSLATDSRVGSIRVSGFGVWSSVEVFDTNPEDLHGTERCDFPKQSYRDNNNNIL